MTGVRARSSRHAITGAAIANCLGTRNDTVLSRAFGGMEAFRPGSDYFAFPFETELGIVPLEEMDESNEAPARAPTRIARVALASVQQLRNAVRVAVARWGPRRVAYVFASSIGGLEHTERHFAPTESLPPSTAGYSYADHAIDATSAAFARHLGVEGPRAAVATACSSSSKALATAARFLDHGLADAAVVGTADSLTRTTIFGFHSLGLLDPTATRPFALDRRGLTLGEGSAYLLLERQRPETRREALGWLAGIGESADAFHQTSPQPNGAGAELAMRRALERAGLAPSDVDLVSAHATGTRLNDAVESAALLRIFDPGVPVSATKSLTGHTLGSSGLTALVLALESLRRQEIPATLRSDPMDPSVGLAVVRTRTAARLTNILINAFGFGGNNASVIVSTEAEAPARRRADA
jgi:3-oxoacyl-[acyl-carrier-protein] synthase-1